MIDLLATQPQYAAHLTPLSDVLRARLLTTRAMALDPSAAATVVSSYADHRLARLRGARRIVVMEHGVGQSYATGHSAYPGGRDRGDAALFLTPNHYSAALWRAAYPRIPAVAIGSPRLDSLPQREPGPGPVVAISFHWKCGVSPWSGNARSDFHKALPALAEAFTVIGHGHPRIIDALAPHYRRLGIEVVRDFDEVCRRADVYVCDNSSTIFEFAATGRPVVLMNTAEWSRRRPAGPGLRFWDAAGVGINCDHQAKLPEAVAQALADPDDVRLARDAALDIVYAHRSGAAARAAEAITQTLAVAA